jgi:adenosylhomocysteine nucleosidase
LDVAIIAAMEEEVAQLRAQLSQAQEVAAFFVDLPIYRGQLLGLDAVLARCGIGKVNAALATQYTIDHFKPRVILTCGVAGAISPEVRIGDVVISTGAQQHDVDARGFGYERGVIPRLATSLFPADPDLVELAAEAAVEKLGAQRVHQGLVVSGDLFVHSREQREEILRFFPGALCTDMEAAAIAQVAAANGIPYLSLQAMSDQADEEAGQAFYQTLDEVLAGLNQVVLGLLQRLRAQL